MAEYYAQRASVGLIVSEATTISKQANGWLNSPGIYSEEQTQAWKPVVNAVHAKGTLFFLQLWHLGRAAHSSFQEQGELPVSAFFALTAVGEIPGLQHHIMSDSFGSASVFDVVGAGFTKDI